MAQQFQLPISPHVPLQLPQQSPELAAYARGIQDAMQDIYRILAERLQNIITSGTLAERPSADGSLRFYFATDDSPPTLYFDDGTWNAV